MNRKYTTEEYARSVEILKRYYEAPAVTTDIIVGFPQETEEEFRETMEFAKRIGLGVGGKKVLDLLGVSQPFCGTGQKGKALFVEPFYGGPLLDVFGYLGLGYGIGHAIHSEKGVHGLCTLGLY